MHARGHLYDEGMTPFRLRSSGAALFAIISLMPWGCGPDEPARGTIVIDTIDGLPRTTNVGAGAWAPEEAWRIGEERFRVGGVDGPQESTFGDVSGMAVDGDRVFVADAQAKEIRVFDRTGRLVTRFGRSGGGPGEFAYVDAIALAPDGSLLARDPQRMRATRFDPAGTVLATFPVRRPYIQFSDGRGFRILADGSIADYVALSVAADSPDTLAILTYAADGTPTDTLRIGSIRRQSVMVREGERPAAGLTIPYTPRGAHAVGPDGRTAWGVGDAYEFTIRSRSGVPTGRVAREVQPAAVTAQDEAEARAKMDDRAREFVTGGRVDEFDLPARRPAFTHMMTDPDGNWWVGAADGWPGTPNPNAWDVFDPTGQFLGTVALPEPMRVLEIGEDYVAGVAFDAFDVSYAVVWDLVKP